MEMIFTMSLMEAKVRFVVIGMNVQTFSVIRMTITFNGYR